MTSTQNEQVCRRLKAYRQFLGLTQEEMGKRTGKNQYYGNIERGTEIPSDLALVQIAEALKIELDWLLHGTGTSPIPERVPAFEAYKNEPVKKSVLPKIQPEPKKNTDIELLSPVVVRSTLTYDSCYYHAEHESQVEILIHGRKTKEGIELTLFDNPWVIWFKPEEIPHLIDLLKDGAEKIQKALI